MPELKVFNTLLGKDIPSGYPNNIFGAQLSGKTLLSLQYGIQYAKRTKGNVLFLDVDGGMEMFCKEWLPVLFQEIDYKCDVFIEPAWNVRYEAPNQKYVHFEIKALQLFGVNGRAEISENGKTEFVPKGVLPNEVQQYIEKKNVKVVVIDSFSQIFKDAFVSQQSFGARARAEDQLFTLIKNISISHGDVLFFCNHHHSVNPIYHSIAMAGGSAVLMNSKIALYLQKMNGKFVKNYGQLHVFRYPNIPEWGKVEYLQYTDKGIVDSDKKTVEDLVAAGKSK